MTDMKRFWVSWYDTEPDYRPFHDPPAKGIIGWWVSGETMSEPPAVTLCVLLDAPSESGARDLLAHEWPETKSAEFRFFDERPIDYIPGDRFPMPEWSKVRVGVSA